MFDITEYNTEFEQIPVWLIDEYKGISAGRANPGLLDSIQADVYGSKQPIKNVASITIEDPRTLRVSPWDKTAISAIERGIQDSGLPLSIVTDSAGLRVIVPQMTEENRKKIMKRVKELHEEARIRVRHIREKVNKSIDEAEDSGEFAEDDNKRFKDQVQKTVDTVNKKLDEILDQKESDIMNI